MDVITKNRSCGEKRPSCENYTQLWDPVVLRVLHTYVRMFVCICQYVDGWRGREYLLFANETYMYIVDTLLEGIAYENA